SISLIRLFHGITASISARNCSRRVTLPLCFQARDSNVVCFIKPLSTVPLLPTARSIGHLASPVQRFPRRVKQSGCCTRLETAGCPHGHDLRVVCSPPIWGDPRSEVPASKAGKLGATPSRPAKPFRCGLLASQLRSERSPRRFDPCRLIQYTSSGLPASPLGFEPKARRFDSCLVFHKLPSANQTVIERLGFSKSGHSSAPKPPEGAACQSRGTFTR